MKLSLISEATSPLLRWNGDVKRFILAMPANVAPSSWDHPIDALKYLESNTNSKLREMLDQGYPENNEWVVLYTKIADKARWLQKQYYWLLLTMGPDATADDSHIVN